MKVATLEPKLGEGIYTVSDVSRILDIRNSKLRYWVKKFWDGRLGEHNNLKYSWGEGRDRAINFHTLIEFYTYYKLREIGVKSKKILHAHHVMSDFLKTPFPFASANVLTDGKSVLFEPEIDQIINADKTLQTNISEFIIPFCTKIDFDRNALAERPCCFC